MATFSIVVPVYNEEMYIEDFFYSIKRKLLDGKDYEIIFVNDGSTDFSEKVMKKLAEENDIVRIVTLEKNYGKEAAFVAGMRVASGDAVILMSMSPANPFEALKAVISKWLAGYEIVHAYRRDTIPNWWKKFKLATFRTASKLFGIKDTILPKPNVELYDRKIADILAELPDRHTYMRNVNVWIDYKIATLYYDSRIETEKDKELIRKRKEEFEKERKDNNLMPPKAIKRRLYAPSLYVAVVSFISFAVLLLSSTLVAALVKGLGVLKLCGFLFTFALLFVSGMYFTRAWIIKRLGRVPGVKTSGEIYKIKELYGFDCLIK